MGCCWFRVRENISIHNFGVHPVGRVRRTAYTFKECNSMIELLGAYKLRMVQQKKSQTMAYRRFKLRGSSAPGELLRFLQIVYLVYEWERLFSRQNSPTAVLVIWSSSSFFAAAASIVKSVDCRSTTINILVLVFVTGPCGYVRWQWRGWSGGKRLATCGEKNRCYNGYQGMYVRSAYLCHDQQMQHRDRVPWKEASPAL